MRGDFKFFWRDRKERRRDRFSAFTLIEILAVVLIIIVLVIILFPYGQRMLSGAREALCASHLRTLSSASQQFIMEHNGSFFSRSYESDLEPYIEGMKTRWSSGGRHKSTLSCPAVNALSGTKFNSGIYSMNYVFINEISGVTQGIPPSNWPLRITNVEKPQKAWIFTEGTRRLENGSFNIDPLAYITYGNIENKGGSAPLFWPHPHEKKNFLFLDGHVESLSWEDIQARTRPDGQSNNPAYKEFYGLKK